LFFFCSVLIIFRERRERESFYSSVERESIDVDSDKKKVDLGVNKFHLMKKISPKCYFFFLLSEKLDMLARIFLDLG
jgi:hypothetical protein